MRLFTATIGTESNTFSPIPTSLDDFRESVFFGPGEHPDDGPRHCTAQLPIARRRAAQGAFDLIEGSCFHASPGGRVNRADYEFMRDRILAEARSALPLDAVVLGLHGAMVAFGYNDVEGDLLTRLRDIVGPDCILAAELDPHCHLTQQRLNVADVLVFYKEYPHTDCDQEAERLFNIVQGMLDGTVHPVTSVYSCRQVGSFPTSHPVMRAFVEDVRALEETPGILSISVGHSYPYADVPEMGCGILVVADGDKTLADRMATQVGERFIGLRGVTTPQFMTIDEGLAAAQALPAGTIAITDASDNAGGGAAADNPQLLRRMVELGIENAAVGPLWDPIAVRTCFAAGLGANIRLRIGGKAGYASGQPFDADVEITALEADLWQSFGSAMTPMGPSAAVRVGGIDVVLNSARTQALGPEMFRGLGIEPADRRLLVLKTSNHFRAGFGDILAGEIHIHTDGLLIRDDYRRIPYQTVARPIWPLDDVPTGALIF